MNNLLFTIAALIFVAIVYILTAIKRSTSTKEVGFSFPGSQFTYTVYQSAKYSPNDPRMILEGNRIDELGYQIYKSHIADLDKIDILIRDNKTGEVMKIVKDGDSESMIGVSHPEHGHIGYLQIETLQGL